MPYTFKDVLAPVELVAILVGYQLIGSEPEMDEPMNEKSLMQ